MAVVEAAYVDVGTSVLLALVHGSHDEYQLGVGWGG